MTSQPAYDATATTEELLDRATESSCTSVPAPAAWLGGLGAVPFLTLAIAGFFLEDLLRGQLLFALTAYGSVILSFLGGIHWGLAMGAASASSADDIEFNRLLPSVIPPLIGWASLAVSGTAGLVILAVAFPAMFLVDLRAGRRAEVPAWYPRLRFPLSMVVVVSLLLGAVA